MSDNYVKVKVILITRTRDALLVDCKLDGVDMRKAWIPLSLVHSADEKKVGNNHATDIVEFRLREWKAMELGL